MYVDQDSCWAVLTRSHIGSVWRSKSAPGHVGDVDSVLAVSGGGRRGEEACASGQASRCGDPGLFELK